MVKDKIDYERIIMAFEQREMSGTLFRNKECDPKKNHPTHQGTCKIEGKEYHMSAWVKESDKAGKFFSVSFTGPIEKKDDKPAF